MPEYLAPGVYVEEIEIGAKPIEGVSTSTAGFLGYAERGPLDKPTLVTSFAEFGRIFGGFLADDGQGILEKIRWLAYAVQGFFENGGKRAFITRVASSSALAASGSLPKIADPGVQIALAEKAYANETGLILTAAVTFTAGDPLMLKDGAQSEFFEFQSGKLKKITLTDGETLEAAYTTGTTIKGGTVPTVVATTTAAAASMGDREITLNPFTGIGENDYLLIVDSDAESGNEVVEVEEIDGNTITTKAALRFDHVSPKDVSKLSVTQSDTLLRNAEAGADGVYVESASGIQANYFMLIGNEYHTVESGQGVTESWLLPSALKYDHDAGKDLIKLESVVDIEASSEGTWGNSIKVYVKPSSISSTQLTDNSSGARLDLETTTGIEIGSILKVPTIPSQNVTVENVIKTSTETYVIVNPSVSLSKDDKVSTEEFDLIVRNGATEETFKNLSLNESHSRFIKKIITEKSSNLIRILQIGNGAAMPMPTTPDDLPGWSLKDGDDGLPADDGQIDTIFEGTDSDEPDDRTGLYTFKNVDDINIAAMPGITSKVLQGKLIIHCETIMRDRFAVLDSNYGANLDMIKSQRNLHDTSFAALYYPWFYAPDPLTGGYINVPPSGHVCGVYARTDVERGVHKAPANEKVNGVFGLEKLNGKFRIVNKGTQEILNPLGVNCIRQFTGRGIRIWGARTISSNSLWKYLNVRRLFLFIEESIEKGTQWVVFEPNDEKLWARVIQTIKQFLTGVWKSGALMGSTPEEAFFIKCDRTTMTQSDIDNGRLICIIGVAPVKPAEFVIFRIAQWQGGSAVTE
jgi:phage tail sheath protein FI